jgi:hypothetical protein
MAQPRKNRGGAPAPRANTAAAQRNRLLAALASQQNQIAALTSALGTLVQLAGAGTHPRLAHLVTADVIDGASVGPPQEQAPEQAILDDPDFQAGAAEGVADFEAGDAQLADAGRLAAFNRASPAWQLGWGAGYDHALRMASRGRRRRTAADENGDPVATTSDQARKPAATDDPTNEGAAPAAANRGVTPDAATTVDTTNVAGPTDPYNKLVDVTAPIPGAVDNVPTPAGSHVPQDINASPPAGDTAFTFTDGGWKNSSRTTDPRARFIASLRLARLRRATGTSDVDELMLAQQIDDGPLPDEGIAVETGALEQIAGQRVPRRTAQRAGSDRLVPQPQSAGRRVPSLAGQGAPRTAAVAGGISDDEFLDLPPS